MYGDKAAETYRALRGPAVSHSGPPSVGDVRWSVTGDNWWYHDGTSWHPTKINEEGTVP